MSRYITDLENIVREEVLRNPQGVQAQRMLLAVNRAVGINPNELGPIIMTILENNGPDPWEHAQQAAGLTLSIGPKTQTANVVITDEGDVYVCAYISMFIGDDTVETVWPVIRQLKFRVEALHEYTGLDVDPDATQEVIEAIGNLDLFSMFLNYEGAGQYVFDLYIETKPRFFMLLKLWDANHLWMIIPRNIDDEAVFEAQMGDPSSTEVNFCSKCGTKLTWQQKRDILFGEIQQKQLENDKRNAVPQKHLQNKKAESSAQKNNKKQEIDSSNQKQDVIRWFSPESSRVVPFVDEEIGDDIVHHIAERPIGVDRNRLPLNKTSPRPNLARVVRSSASSVAGSPERCSTNSIESLVKACEGLVFDAQVFDTSDFNQQLDWLIKTWNPDVTMSEFVCEAQIFEIGFRHSISEDVKTTIKKMQETIDNLTAKLPSMAGVEGGVHKAATNIYDILKFITTSWPALFAWYFSVYKIAYNIGLLIKGSENASLKRLGKWVAIYTSLTAWLIMTNDIVRVAVEESTRVLGVIIHAQYYALSKSFQMEGRRFDRKNRTWVSPEDENFEEVFEAQVDNDTDLLGKSASVVLMALSAQLVGKTPDGKKLEKFMSTISMVPRASTGVTHVADATVEIFRTCVNFIRENMLGLSPLTWLESTFPEVDRWCSRVQMIQDEARSPKWRISKANGQRIYHLYREGNSLTLNRYKQIDNTRVRMALQAHMNVIKKLMVPFDQANLGGISSRMQPVTVFLTGTSGIGKSALSIPLVTAVLARILPREQLEALKLNYMDFIYNRQTEHQYWDRYFGQIACIFDDFLQLKDVATERDNELMDIIRCTNIFPHVLHMAALENKGTTCFSSRFILATSNTMKINAESINETEAVTRRFDLSYKVIPKEKYAVRSTDGTLSAHCTEWKLDLHHPEVVGNPCNLDVYDFYELRWRGGEATMTGAKISFEALITAISSKYVEYEQKSEEYNEAIHEKLMSRLESERSLETPEAQLSGTSMTEQEIIDKFEDFVKMQEVSATFDDKEAAVNEEEDPLADVDLPTGRYAIWDETYTGEDDVSLYEDDIHTEPAMRILMGCGEDGWLVLDEVASILRAGLARWGLFQSAQSSSLMLVATWKKISPRNWESACAYNEKGKSPKPGAPFIAAVSQMTRSVNWPQIAHKFDLFIRRSDKNYDTLIESRSTLQRWNDHVKEAISSLTTKSSVYTVLTVVGSILAVWGIYRGVTYMFSDSDEEEEEDLFEVQKASGASGRKKLKGARRVARYTHDYEAPDKHYFMVECDSGNGDGIRVRVDGSGSEEVPSWWHAQNGGDLGSLQVAKKLVSKAIYSMHVFDSERRLGHVLFIKGRIALLPNHYIRFFLKKIKEGVYTPDTEILLRNDFLPMSYKLKVRDFINCRGSDWLAPMDLAVFLAPVNVHQHKDITKLFIEHTVLDKPIDLTVHAIILEQDHSWRMYGGKAEPINSFKVKYGDDQWVVSTGYSYKFPTMPGDCGSPLVLNNKSVGPGKIMGLHIAGNTATGMGIASALDRQTVDKIVNLFTKAEQICQPEDPLLEVQCCEMPYEANQLAIAKFDGVVPSTGLTKVIRSRLHGQWGPSKVKPAYLSPIKVGDEIVDPRVIGLKGYCAGNWTVNEDVLDAVCKNMSSFFINLTSRIERRKPVIFSFSDVIVGIPGVKYADSIDRNTSPGFPFVLERPNSHPGKTWWLGKEQDYDMSNERMLALEDKCEHIIREAKLGRRTLHVFIDFPKDETRPIEKVDAFQTRSISSCAFDFSIVCRMYFLDFSIFIMENRIETRTCVGINPRSNEWDILARKLNRFSKKFAGDFHGFDKKQIAQFLWLVLHIINEWYDDGEENALIRVVLWSDVVYSIHLFDGTFIQWIMSLPSGFILTVIINSLVHEAEMQYCFAMLHPAGLHGLQFYYEHVENQTYGDDGVASISDVVSPWFNQITISRAMAVFGMDYTDEKKEGVDVPWRDLSEVTFLKRAFRYDTDLGAYLAPLSLDSILETPYWTKRGSGPEQITKDNVCVALMELGLHSEDVYREWAPRIIHASRKCLKWVPRLRTYAANKNAARYYEEEW